jgi:hypothetical protein
MATATRSPRRAWSAPRRRPPADVHRLDKIVVTVTARFQPTIALLHPFDIVSVDRRTIVKEP